MNTWTLGCTTGAAQRPRERQVPAGACHTVLEEIRRAKRRCGFPEEARVMSCYAAGRDGLWLPRFCRQPGQREHRGGLGAPRGASPLPPGKDRSPGGVQAAHDAAASCGRGKEGLECRAGAQRCRGRPPPAAPGTLDHAARSAARDESDQRVAGRRWHSHAVARRGGDAESRRSASGMARCSPRPGVLACRREWQKVQQLTAQIGSLEAERRTAWRTSAEQVERAESASSPRSAGSGSRVRGAW